MLLLAVPKLVGQEFSPRDSCSTEKVTIIFGKIDWMGEKERDNFPKIKSISQLPRQQNRFKTRFFYFFYFSQTVVIYSLLLSEETHARELRKLTNSPILLTLSVKRVCAISLSQETISLEILWTSSWARTLQGIQRNLNQSQKFVKYWSLYLKIIFLLNKAKITLQKFW